MASSYIKKQKREFAKEAGNRLGVLRRHLGETPESFAAQLDMTTRNYLAYERGIRTGHGWHLLIHRLHAISNVSLDWLIAGGYPDQPRNDNRPFAIGGQPIPPRLRLAGEART